MQFKVPTVSLVYPSRVLGSLLLSSAGVNSVYGTVATTSNPLNWSKNKRQVCQNVFLSNFSQRLKFSIRVKHIDESCPRLSTQVVFTAAFLKMAPSHVSVSSGLLVLGARVRNLLWGVVCPRKLFERESSRSRGDNNGLVV